MRLLLYNIRYGTGHQLGYHIPLPFAGFFKRTAVNLQRIISFIASVNPDIVALVEVDSGSYRCGHFCQAQTIADRLGYNFIIESKYNINSLALRVPVLRQQSNAILTKQTVEKSHFHYFEQGVKQLVIQTDLQAIAIFIVHLSLKYRHRQNQLEQLHALTQEHRQGSYNCRRLQYLLGQPRAESFSGGDRAAKCQSYQCTFPSKPCSMRQIDFILHSAGIRIDNFYIPDIRLSDHSPLICDFSCVLT